MINNQSLMQFKLVTGEEIVCEVLQWPNLDDDEDDTQIIIRRAMKLMAFEPRPGGLRVYMFRPWMVLQSESTQVQSLFDYQIVGEAIPSAQMITQYQMAMKLEVGEDSDQPDPLMADITPSDSDTPNIITFPGRVLH
jgi:hypothetical protein